MSYDWERAALPLQTLRLAKRSPALAAAPRTARSAVESSLVPPPIRAIVLTLILPVVPVISTIYCYPVASALASSCLPCGP